ncbi:hypothetical protein Cgig2_000339 [Carnegiea gigantea]|uniref:PXMP2/4 family protein 4 n=1 Tax=Carnegiea gigantea TaxID=171969 RepID=A0A9Q1GS63_9CARY|nr:hypothetical protein Cgig2_000339 [Carnegiea gigantea]
MVISVASKVRRGSVQLCRGYEAVESGIWDDGIRFLTSHHRQYHHLQRRAYAFFNSNGAGKPRNSKFPHFTYSTSSSSVPSGFLKWYLGMLETRPFITKSISSSLIFAVADVTSQMITLAPSDTYDMVRTLRVGVYGFLIMGPSQHLWFNFLSKIFPKKDLLSTFKKITMGQTIYGPIVNSLFFSYNAALRAAFEFGYVSNTYRMPHPWTVVPTRIWQGRMESPGETKEDIVARLRRDLLPTLKNGLMYWPLCDFLTFKFIPVHLQPLANSTFAYLWTIYLAYVASLKKVGEE